MKHRGRTKEFLEIIEDHKGIIYKIVNTYSKDSDDRKDLSQEIIVQLWKSFENYNNQYKYSTWIYRIALNVSITHFRKETNRRKINHPIENSIIYMDDSYSNENNEHNLSILQEIISELKEMEKALVLLYLEEKSYKEISEIIGISESNVATKLSRIKLVLKEKFNQLKDR